MRSAQKLLWPEWLLGGEQRVLWPGWLVESAKHWERKKSSTPAVVPGAAPALAKAGSADIISNHIIPYHLLVPCFICFLKLVDLPFFKLPYGNSGPLGLRRRFRRRFRRFRSTSRELDINILWAWPGRAGRSPERTQWTNYPGIYHESYTSYHP